MCPGSVTSAPGSRPCVFDGEPYFSSPRTPFLRRDDKICICDDGEWEHVPGRARPGIEPGQIVDPERDIVKGGGCGGGGGGGRNTDSSVWNLPPSRKNTGSSSGIWNPPSREQTADSTASVWNPDSEGIWNDPPPAQESTDSSSGIWNPDSESIWNPCPTEETPDTTAEDFGIWNPPPPEETTAGASGGVWNPPPEETTWSPPSFTPCTFLGRVFPHAPSTPVASPMAVCYCDDGRWMGCAPPVKPLRGDELAAGGIWNDGMCEYQGEVYPEGPAAPVVGPTHVCFCVRGRWERCKLKGKQIGTTTGEKCRRQHKTTLRDSEALFFCIILPKKCIDKIYYAQIIKLASSNLYPQTAPPACTAVAPSLTAPPPPSAAAAEEEEAT